MSLRACPIHVLGSDRCSVGNERLTGPRQPSRVHRPGGSGPEPGSPERARTRWEAHDGLPPPPLPAAIGLAFGPREENAATSLTHPLSLRHLK